ncbi:bifunctional acetaldehyde-CoA/alcohol dehydrogenase [Hutsoniella sourekii]
MTEQEKVVTPEEQVDKMVQKGLQALNDFMSLNQEQVDYIVGKASVAALDHHGELAKLAVEDTGRGVFEDKATKNLFASEHVTNYMRDVKTVGVVDRDEFKGTTTIAEPVGVICGIVPTTNPTSTAIFKSLISLKTRNPIIFSFHPSAMKCSIRAAEIVRDAAIAAGAPENCIQWIEEPSMEATNALMNHDGVATILATGGNAMVRSAYSCGKPALGVGAGNVPAYVEKTADVKQAVNDLVMSKSFDNGMICATESIAIIDQEIYDQVIDEMKSYQVYFVNAEEKAKLEEYMFGAKANSQACSGAALNSKQVGMPATWIAKEAGFEVPEQTRVLAAEVAEVGENEPLTREKLSPVYAVLKVDSTEAGLDAAEKMVEFNGLGHTAAIHTQDDEVALEYGKRVKTIRIVRNAPSALGGIGDVYNSFIPSLTLGCGSYGNNSVGDNVQILNLLNFKKIGERQNNMQWFKVPRVYFEKHALKYLTEMDDLNRVMIISDHALTDLGYVQQVVDRLEARDNNVIYDIFNDIEPDPDITTVRKGADALTRFKPDAIVAIGGGSVMDAAKVMWMFYEQPDINFEDMHQKFMDIRKRAFRFPDLGSVAQFIAVPTTSGTGSEVTPFAVISDKAKGLKYPLADYSILPNVAIVDSALVEKVPAKVAAASGYDVLVHATEAYVSIMASHYTDGLALQAIKLVFDNLVKSVNEGDLDARHQMHDAATMAGMAFGNAFLGITHSMAHKIGGRFHTVHGETNAILMPYVIRYNGTRPTKLSNWPKYTHYQADEKYQDIARMLGLPASTPEEAVESYAKACYELGVKIGIPMSFKDQGIDRDEWFEATEQLAYDAYGDQCTPVNPRLAMVDHMKEIMEDAYLGYGEQPGRIKY